MAMQFMQVMHQSVHQVISAPHFGFEWVKPDYHFELPADDDDDLLKVLEDCSAVKQEQDNSNLSPCDPVSCSSGADSDDLQCFGITLPPGTPPSVASQSGAAPSSGTATASPQATPAVLSPSTIDELYEALKEYSDYYSASGS